MLIYMFWKILHIGKVQPSDKTKKKPGNKSDCTCAEFTLAASVYFGLCLTCAHLSAELVPNVLGVCVYPNPQKRYL